MQSYVVELIIKLIICKTARTKKGGGGRGGGGVPPTRGLSPPLFNYFNKTLVSMIRQCLPTPPLMTRLITRSAYLAWDPPKSAPMYDSSHSIYADIAISRKSEGRKEMFYLTTHPTHFICGYMVNTYGKGPFR